MASEGGPRDYSWAEWAEIADLTGEIDFGCDFDCNGRCKSTKNAPPSRLTERGCCVHCANCAGYLKEVPIEAVEELEALFSDADGFWRPDGCVLPQAWRSSTCLEYYCGCPGPGEDLDVPGKPAYTAWNAWTGLVDNTGGHSVAQVRALLQGAGLLRTEQLVTISDA